MHLRFVAEGWDKDLDYMEKWIGQMILPMEVINNKGKKEVVNVPCYLRPFRMYDLIFPRENLDVILNTLTPKGLPMDEVALCDNKGTKVFKKSINWIRKLMKLKKIPKADRSQGRCAVPDKLLKNIRIVGLGIKEDVDFVNHTGVKQEML